MQILLITFLIAALSGFSANAVAGKKHCQSYLAKLNNIKAQQRQGHSLKKSNSLAKKEAKARKVWWQCETGKLKKKSASKAKRSKANSRVMTQKLRAKKRQTAAQKVAKPVPMITNSALVIKGPYQGEKLQAWLSFYQRDEGCHKPKSIQVFAKCMEQQRIQQQEFEQQYRR